MGLGLPLVSLALLLYTLGYSLVSGDMGSKRFGGEAGSADGGSHSGRAVEDNSDADKASRSGYLVR